MNFTRYLRIASYGMAAIVAWNNATCADQATTVARSESTTVLAIDRHDATASASPSKKLKPSARGVLKIVEPAVTGPRPTPGQSSAPLAANISPPRSRTARGDLVFVPSAPTATNSPPMPTLATAAERVSGKNSAEPSSPSNVMTTPRHEPIELASHQPPVVQPRPKPTPSRRLAAKKPRPRSLDPIDALLLRAHTSSLQAKTEADYAAIIDQCIEAIRLQPNRPKLRFARQLVAWAMNRRGQLRLDAGRDDLANSDFQAALDYHPNHWRALHNRGVTFAQAGQFAEAFDDFTQVIELNPDYAKAYANRATLFVQANDLQAALEDYQSAIEVDGQLATAHLGLARVLHQLGRLDEAVEQFDAAAQVDPTSPEIICGRADLLADLGRYRQALADYARTIELDPDFGHAYRNGAWLLATCPVAEFRDEENAVLGARQALELGYGERYLALDTLAAALANAGNFDEAAAAEKEAADLAPDDVKFTYLSRWQQYQDGQPLRTQPVDAPVSQAIYEATDQ